MENNNYADRREHPYILVVDDILKNLQVIGNMLEEDGYEVSVANSGKDAIEMIFADKPDLILLDVMMPEMSGFEVCQYLKTQEDFDAIPIIFLTAKTETKDIVKGFEIGGVDYVTKPFKKEELLARIATHLELKFSRDTIAHQNIRLEKLNQEKNEFLGITAHDLKNPLGAILGISEVLIGDTYEFTAEEMHDFINDIHKSASQMFQLVTDLLDINAIEEGRMEMSFSEFDINDVLIKSVDKFDRSAADKDIVIHLEKSGSPLMVFADDKKVEQSLDNLVSNAVKFSPFNKNIYVRAYKIPGKQYACVEVRDEGPGISEDDQKKLFKKFTKLTARPTGKENSTGLGLSIVKKFIEEMFGKIWCESELGNGSSFKFTIPLVAGREQ